MPRLTSKGQVTIPQPVRERLGLVPGAEVEFVEEGGVVVVRCESRVRSSRFSRRQAVAGSGRGG